MYFLTDHVSSFIGPFVINETKSFLLNRDITAQTVYEFSQKGTGPITSTGVQAAGFLTSSYAKARNESHHPDIQFMLVGNGIYPGMQNHLGHSFNIPFKSLGQFYGPNIGKDSFTIINLLSRPKSRGAIRLASANPRDYPLIFPNYFTEQQDIDVLVEGTYEGTKF